MSKKNEVFVKEQDSLDTIDELELKLNRIMNSELVTPHNKSKYDAIKRDNDDIELDVAVANNGGKFSICNMGLLEV